MLPENFGFLTSRSRDSDLIVLVAPGNTLNSIHCDSIVTALNI